MIIINLTLTDLHNSEALTLQEKDINCIINNENYQIIDHAGTLQPNGVIILNYVPITLEGRMKFEERFQNRPKKIENEDGFWAIRTLRPLSGNMYVILSQWDSINSFKNWQNSSAYSHAHKNRGTKEGIDQEKGVLGGKPSHRIYQVSTIYKI
ncbi:antibiotic biosynthesis monooxygenase family protein [Virgibacillus siamensis]|uniref:antibiotic biosynthesis monooxygenase family protein n=1 Tax=Virgibacillus siamensis TaxID=480071 RepID=UPI0031E44FEE